MDEHVYPAEDLHEVADAVAGDCEDAISFQKKMARPADDRPQSFSGNVSAGSIASTV